MTTTKTRKNEKHPVLDFIDEMRTTKPAIEHLKAHSAQGSEERAEALAILAGWRQMFEARIEQIDDAVEKIEEEGIIVQADTIDPVARKEADVLLKRLTEAKP